MFSRPMLLVGILAAAAIVPYVLLDKSLSQTAQAQFNRLVGRSESAAGPLMDMQLPWTGSDGADGQAAATAIEPLPVALEEAFHMDLTPQWVTSRWPRVSTVLGEPEQLGMRVALVSGTQPDDVAGSLTYYFDQHHKLQRITFFGLTGDERRLMATLVRTYQLKSAPTTDVARWIAGDAANPTSSVVVRHLPIVRADATNARVEVAVDVRRADAVTSSRNWRNAEPTVPMPQSYRPW